MMLCIMFVHGWQVKAAVLDPEYDFNVERTLTKDDVQKLIQVCHSQTCGKSRNEINCVMLATLAIKNIYK